MGLDPAAIAAMVPESTAVPLDVHVRLLEEVTDRGKRISELEHAIDADQDHIALLEQQLAEEKP